MKDTNFIGEEHLNDESGYDTDGFDQNGKDRRGGGWHRFYPDGYDSDDRDVLGFNKSGWRDDGIHISQIPPLLKATIYSKIVSLHGQSIQVIPEEKFRVVSYCKCIGLDPKSILQKAGWTKRIIKVSHLLQCSVWGY
jgi:hypothetical protein